MNKKIFSLLLMAVLFLAQFSTASAITTRLPGVVTIASLPTFHNAAPIELEWSVTGMDGVSPQYIFVWTRTQPSSINTCTVMADVSGLTVANGVFSWNMGVSDQDIVEFWITVESIGTCDPMPLPPYDTEPAMASTFIDAFNVIGFEAFPPSLSPILSSATHVSCNTFEYWSLVSDSRLVPPGGGYSGLKAWNQSITGSFAPPISEGPVTGLLSWVYTFPPTAYDNWTFTFQPEDFAGNKTGKIPFRLALPIIPDELEDCADFTDTAGNENEAYIRYLADLGLISGFADGTYGPENTLTRAEAATLFEKTNGWVDEVGLPDSAPSSACTFTDVSDADWFAGWVWQACKDGFMNGLGGGLFGPNDLLTRGQVVTVMNNIANNLPIWSLPYNSYLDTPNIINHYFGNNPTYRTAVWTDVAIGDYYAIPAIQAYGWGVAEGTSATTFSPNQPATRGEFAKMLYRALSRFL